jgi:arylsulfatase A-like enzyme
MTTRLHAALPAVLLLALLACLHAAAAPKTHAKLNIILIPADDLSWKDVEYAGSTFYRTPNVDLLAREGMRFSQAYWAACVCSPSRGSIYPGKNPARTALTTVWEGREGPDDRLFDRSKNQGEVIQCLEARHRHALSQSETTFTQVPAEAGYVTGCHAIQEEKIMTQATTPEGIELLAIEGPSDEAT